MNHSILSFLFLALLTTGCHPEPGRYDDMQGIIINEVSPARSIGKEAWIEICNKNDREINLRGMQVVLTDDKVTEEVIATLQEGVLKPKGRHVISSGEVAFSLPVLRATMEEIGIRDAENAPINSFSVKYDYGSASKPDDGGSFARIPDMIGDWTITSTATPGSANYKIVYHSVSQVLVNEVCPSQKWIELYNAGASDLQMEYCHIDADGKVLHTFAPECIIPSHQKHVVECDCAPALLSNFTLFDNAGKKVVSFSASSLPPAPDGCSWSRLPDITGDWKLSNEPTKGAANISVSTTEEGLVINEVSLAGWVEIHNATDNHIRTAGIVLKGDGTTFYQSGSTTIAAGSRIVVEADVSSCSRIVLSKADGTGIDSFRQSDVREDGREATASTSWSRLPDGTGRWFTVLTPSKGEQNYGIPVGNTIAIWVNHSSMEAIDLEKLCKLGIGNILIHEFIFRPDKHNLADTKAFIAKAHALGMAVHIWMQCFWWSDAGWTRPVIDPVYAADGKTVVTPPGYHQTLFDEIIQRGLPCLAHDIDGIHFDYIRFSGVGQGMASSHDYPDYGISGAGAVTEFCRQAHEAFKGRKPEVILSAALMGESGAISYYGQDPAAMTQYIDIIMPMAYISSYNYTSSKNIAVANWFAARCNDKQVWHGISTYDSSTQGLTAAEIYRDCENITNSNAHGIALFRYGLGTLPNLSSLFVP